MLLQFHISSWEAGGRSTDQEITRFRQNLAVQHCNHKLRTFPNTTLPPTPSPPPAPPPPFFRSNSSNMYGYVSQVVSTLQNFQPKPCVYFSFLSFILHSLWLDCPHKIFWIQKLTMFSSCNFYSFLFLPPFWFRCKCSPCLPVPEFSKHKFLPLEWKTDFQTYKNQNCIKFVITQYYYHHHHHYHRHHRFSWQMIT